MTQPRHTPNSPRPWLWHRASRQSGVAEPGARPHLTHFIEDGSSSSLDLSVADALAYAEAKPSRLALFLYPAPTPAEIAEFATAWDLHPLVVEDLLHAKQRPKAERYGDVLFLVVRSARYIDATEEVEFAEFHILARPQAIAVFCQDKVWIDGSDGTSANPAQALLDSPELLQLGPEAVAYRLIDAIVDGFTPVLQGIAVDREQIEREVFSGSPTVAERIYRLSSEVIDMQHSATSLAEVLAALRRGFGKYHVPDQLQSYLQDVSDHLARVTQTISEDRDALSQILNVNATLVAQRQNEDMKKISGWAAILFAPTLVAAIYGMNFDLMPELHWAFGYPAAVILMVVFAVALYVIFKIRRWM